MAATAAITNQGQTYFMRLGLSLFMAFLFSIEADLGRFGPRIKSSRRTPSRRLPEGRRLSDAAMGILKATNGEWLFPSETSETGHIVDPRRGADADKITVPFTLHGLRATYISPAHAAGVSDRHAPLLANHSVHSSDVHGGYILPDPEALRPSQQRITDYLRAHGLLI